MRRFREMFGGWLLLVLAVALFVLGCGDASTQSKDKDKTYDIKGKVTKLDTAKDKPVMIDHEDIPGVMPAMEMPFAVESAKVLEGIKAGDEVHGKLKVKDDGEYIITELHKR